MVTRLQFASEVYGPERTTILYIIIKTPIVTVRFVYNMCSVGYIGTYIILFSEIQSKTHEYIICIQYISGYLRKN